MPLLAEPVPADLVLAAELRNLVPRRHEREVRGVEGDVLEERFRRVALVHEADRVIDEGVGRIETGSRLHALVLGGQRIGLEIVRAALDDAEIMVETALARPVEFLLPRWRG